MAEFYKYENNRSKQTDETIPTDVTIFILIF